MKRHLLLTLIMTCVFMFACSVNAFAASNWDGNIPDVNAATTFGGGDGSYNDPYRIITAAHLAQLSANVRGSHVYNGDYFILEDDIYLNSARACLKTQNSIVISAES